MMRTALHKLSQRRTDAETPDSAALRRGKRRRGNAERATDPARPSPLTPDPSPLNTRPCSPAFTLIEVLVVVAIIALLISILLPSLAQARLITRSTVCLSQLRQMAIAAQAYTTTQSGSYPPYMYTTYTPEFETVNFERAIEYCWDYSRFTDAPGATPRILPGLLWQGRMMRQIQQCPSFQGSANWANDPYTGYNYNTSCVGWYYREPNVVSTTTGPVRVWDVKASPARQDQIRRPGQCALFGDGEYSGGANKFMRSPWGIEKGARDDVDATLRLGGTQGYRHLSKTNVAFADGHGESRAQRYTDTYDFIKPDIAKNVGFLSATNSMYSLN